MRAITPPEATPLTVTFVRMSIGCLLLCFWCSSFFPRFGDILLFVLLTGTQQSLVYLNSHSYCGHLYDIELKTVNWLAVTFLLVAACCYSFNISTAKTMMKKVEPEAVICLIMGLIALMTTPALFFEPIGRVAQPRGVVAALGLCCISGQG